MAVLGLTKLEIVNQVLEAINVPPVSALPSASSDTTSIAARAEDVVDRVGRRVLGEGWPCNTTYGKKHTSSGTPSVITVDADTLKIRCVAPGRYRDRLSLQGDAVFIQDEGTTDFGSATDVYLDVVSNLSDIEDASPDVKERIAAEAAQEFQRRQKGSQVQDGWYGEEKARADIQTDRLARPGQQPWNPAPLLPQSQPREDR